MRLFLILIGFACNFVFSAVLINEVQTTNMSTKGLSAYNFSRKYDREVYYDWIELYNNGSREVDLEGYYLSDNVNKPKKWVFPSAKIAAGQYLIVYAPGADLADDSLKVKVLTADFKLSASGEKVVLSDASGNVLDMVDVPALLADVSWQRYPDGGASWFYSDSPSPSASNKNTKATTVANPPRFQTPGGFYESLPPSAGMSAHALDHQGEHKPYAKEGVSSVEPANGSSYFVNQDGGYSHIKYNLGTSDENDYSGYEMFVPENVSLVGANRCELIATIPQGKVLDIGFHQDNLDGRPRHRVLLTGTGKEKDTYIVPMVDPNGVLDLGRITSFKIRAGSVGEMVVKLFDLHFYANANSGGPVSLVITADSGDEIRYTTDGSIPTSSSSRYSSPLTIDKTTFIRARAFNSNKLASPVVGNSYFVNQSYGVPVVSIIIDKDDFTGSENGIYVLGPGGTSGGEPNHKANYWKNWEKVANFEFFEANGTQGVSQTIGLKIFGRWSRMLSQKSMAVHSRKSYGKEGIDYKLFTNRSFRSYKNILLRSGGNDGEEGIIRDPVVTGLVHNADIEVQAWRPCLLLVNGVNMGMYNMREKINEHYIANHYPNANPDHINLMFKHNEVKAGSDSQYVALTDYLKKNDISQATHYNWVKEQMDVGNYAAYQVTEIYAANADWPGNNIKYWRHRDQGNKWRWILYDTDQTFDIWEGKSPAHINTLDQALNGTSESSPSRLVLNSLITNQEFSNLFVVTLTDFLNTHLKTSTVKKHIDSLRNEIEPFMSYHWNSTFVKGNHYMLDANISKMKRFAEDRPDNVLGHFRSKFNLGSMVKLSVKTVGTGSVKLTSHAFVQGDWSGDYFQNVPVTLTATPVNGHPFTGWSGASSSKDLSITLPMSSAASVTATFGNDPNYKAPAEPPKVIVPVVGGVTLRTGVQLQLVNKQLAIELPRSGAYTLTLLNMQGRVLSRQNLQGQAGANLVPLTNHGGLMIAQVRQGNQMRTLMLPKIMP